MSRTQLAANPFALMMNPEAIFAAIERSERLACLKSRVCRPLDEPRSAESADVKAFDAAIEATQEPVLDVLDEGGAAFETAPSLAS